MRKRWLIVFSCLVFAQAQGASFDCGKACTKVEKLICADKKLSKLDEELVQVYALALRASTTSTSIKSNQNDWLELRNRCGDGACLQQAYQARLAELQIDGHRRPEEPERFSWVQGKDNPLCQEYKRFLEGKTAADGEPPMCGRAFGPDYPAFKQVAWREISPYDHPELAVQVYRYLHYWPWDRPEITPYITEKEYPGYLSGMKWRYDENRMHMWQAEVDLDNDGKPEPVLRVLDDVCDNVGRGGSHPPRWTMPVMVLDSTGKGIDTVKSEWILGVSVLPPLKDDPWQTKGLHGIDTDAYDVFTYEDTAYFDRWETDFPDRPGQQTNFRYSGLTVYRVNQGKATTICRFKFKKLKGPDSN